MTSCVPVAGTTESDRRLRSPGLRLSLLMTLAIMGTQGEPLGAKDSASTPPCAATGAEALQPALSEAEACSAFVAALHEALAGSEAAATSLEGISVSLRFGRNGVARADVARDGQHWFDMNFAMMDRPLDHGAIRQLAQQVAQRMTEESGANA